MTGRPRPAMIFAAGRGRRMGALSRTIPKPLFRVGGETLLDHALGWARDAGAAPIVVNLHHLGGRVAAHLAGTGAVLSPEDGGLLETGGGLRAALPLLGRGPVHTVNADAIWSGPNPLAVLADAWEPARFEALLLVVPRDRARAHAGAGDFALDRAGLLCRGRDVVYTGAQIIATDRLASVPQRAFSLNVVWDQMIAAGRLGGVVYPGEWCDVGTVHGLREARRMRGTPDV